MAKFYGKIGYIKTAETRPGIWEEQSTERSYFGDTIRNQKKWDNSSNINDNINVSNEISIVADPYALENLGNIKYVYFMGAKWKVSDIDVQYPRLILSIGGLYNE